MFKLFRKLFSTLSKNNSGWQKVEVSSKKDSTGRYRYTVHKDGLVMKEDFNVTFWVKQ